ncbi:MAG: endonuclease I [Candidatus Muiribacterium halophilum]|uniref:Endonuclease I n=1 Tax=Muiribacterium halophilum TaxID=2053465 RepID=A0A2N5ZFU4_MUIH1|nr:MAG: endonuclease I [Candidatus Muirbacterium halophilum]
MKKILLITLLVMFSLSVISLDVDIPADKSDAVLKQYQELLSDSKDLKNRLRDLIAKGHKNLGYKKARAYMFLTLFNENGKVEVQYTGKVLAVKDSLPNANVMNTEHIWPQSRFGRNLVDLKKCDLHHLMPTDSKVNSRRGNYPFGVVISSIYQRKGSMLGYDVYRKLVFEPRDEVKGDIARAMFYFSIRYSTLLDDRQENTLRKWSKLDPVDDKERKRNKMIFEFQGNRNPFIDVPGLESRIRDF